MVGSIGEAAPVGGILPVGSMEETAPIEGLFTGIDRGTMLLRPRDSKDSTVAAAIGKRYLLGIEGFKQDYRKVRGLASLLLSSSTQRRTHEGPGF